MEAESFTSNDDNGAARSWELTSTTETPGVTPDPDPSHADSASGGAYLESLPDTRVTGDDPMTDAFFGSGGDGPTLSYDVNFPVAGTYYVWVRAYSTGGEDNGIHVGLDGDWPASSERLQFCSGKNQWTWSSAQRDSGGTACGIPHTITIDVPTAGAHTVMFSMREDGFEFDKWIMTTDETYVPEGAGPDETG